MENPVIINLMRIMQVNRNIPLEEVHRVYPNITKLYRGRPEMLTMTMSNGRNVQAFRGGKVQILGCVDDVEAENMRLNFMIKLRLINTMRSVLVTKMKVSNLVISVQLKSALCLRKIALTDANYFHEIELFPAAIIRKWHPVSIAAFHNGHVILTGIKSIEHFYQVMSDLNAFLYSNRIL